MSAHVTSTDESFLVLPVAACDPLVFKKERKRFFLKKEAKTFIRWSPA
jgi:hypothetical protein